MRDGIEVGGSWPCTGEDCLRRALHVGAEELRGGGGSLLEVGSLPRGSGPFPALEQWAVHHHVSLACLYASFGALLVVFFSLILCCCCAGSSEEEEEPEADTGLPACDTERAAGAALAFASAKKDETEKLAEAKRKKMAVMMKSVVKRKQLEKIWESLEDKESQLQELLDNKVDYEARKKRVKRSIDKANALVDGYTHPMFAYTLPFIAARGIVVQNLQMRQKMAVEEAKRLFEEEAKGALADVRDCFGVSGTIGGEIVRAMSNFEVPPIGSVMACAFAVPQLKVLYYRITFMMVAAFWFLFTSGLAFAWRPKKCLCGAPFSDGKDQKWMFYWFGGDVVIHGLSFLIYISLQRAAKAKLADVDEPPPFVEEESVNKAIRDLIKHFLVTGSEALQRIDDIILSCAYKFANVLLILSTAWVTFGVFLLFETDWNDCPGYPVVMLRIRCLLAMVFFLPTFLSLYCWVWTQYLGSHEFEFQLLHQAHRVDQEVGNSVPIATMLINGLLPNTRSLGVAGSQRRLYEVLYEDVDRKVTTFNKELEDLKAQDRAYQDEIARLRQIRDKANDDDDRDEDIKEMVAAARESVAHAALNAVKSAGNMAKDGIAFTADKIDEVSPDVLFYLGTEAGEKALLGKLDDAATEAGASIGADFEATKKAAMEQAAAVQAQAEKASKEAQEAVAKAHKEALEAADRKEKEMREALAKAGESATSAAAAARQAVESKEVQDALKAGQDAALAAGESAKSAALQAADSKEVQDALKAGQDAAATAGDAAKSAAAQVADSKEVQDALKAGQDAAKDLGK